MRSRSVGPQLIEFVKIAQFGLKDMYQHIAVIHHDPNAIVQPFDPPYFLPELLEHLLFDPPGNRLDLCRGVGIANDERRTNSAVKRTQVQRYDIFGFLILYSSCNRFDQFTLKLLSVLRR